MFDSGKTNTDGLFNPMLALTNSVSLLCPWNEGKFRKHG